MQRQRVGGDARGNIAAVSSGDKPITVCYRGDRVGGEVVLSEDWRVNLDDALIDRLREWLAPENVQVVY